MEKWKGKVAIVTGASAGIGEALVRALVHHGMIVVGFARRLEKMKALADELAAAGEPGKMHGCKTDLRQEDDILAAFQWVDDELGGADVLVNNAGVAKVSFLEDGLTEDWRNMLDLNVLSVCICTREYLQSMARRNCRTGHIFVINSVVGHMTEVAVAGVYTATKHASRALTSCLRRELSQKGSAIKVTNISPGLTRTEASGGYLQNHAQAVLEATDIAQALIDALSASSVTQVCEVVLTPCPNRSTIY